MPRRPIWTGILFLAFLGLALFVLSYLLTLWMGRSPFGGPRIGVVHIQGVILDARPVLKHLNRYREDPSIQAILVRIESPGGAVAPSQEIYREIRRIREETPKKVVASMGSVAASGGYYIASAADKVVANPGTITGSIGVIMELADLSPLLEKVGVRSQVIKSGPFKDTGSVFRPMTPEDRKVLQELIDNVYQQFIEAVAEGRGMDVETVRRLADGRVYSGAQALELGLVDALGNFEDAVRLAAELAGIPGRPRLVEPRPRFSLWDLLTQKISLTGLESGFIHSGHWVRLSYLWSW